MIGFLELSIATIVIGILYLLLSMIVREVAEHLNHEHITFHKASSVALPVTGVFVLAYLFSSVQIVSQIIMVLSIPALLFSVRREYAKNWEYTIIFSIMTIGIFILTLIAIATIYWAIQVYS